jgi:nicotinate phosphoribosyltransferase
MISPTLSPLHTDLYQLTMAYGYWKSGMQDHEAVFHLTYRKNPFGSAYTLACGLEAVIQYLRDFRFQPEDISYLSGLKGNDGQALFEPEFLDYLAAMEFSCDVHALPEGTLAFPKVPLLRVTGPIIQAQILETPLLNLINFQTLIATKASRICRAADGDTVLEFGLRRAQGPDGGLSASRAAYLGGCHATSNVLAGQLYDIPVKGTHAHSWIMAFEEELAAFETYAQALPNNCIFLVDTYDSLEGTRRAVRVARHLREVHGKEMVGIRLDSGDLAELSIAARKILDEGGFPEARIVASSDLDEYEIRRLKAQGARIDIWGVGTRLATAYDQPALGGVYKLSAIRAPRQAWRYTLKLSEQPIKVSDPGILQVRRVVDEKGMWKKDIIFEEDQPLAAEGEDLLQPIFEQGKLIYLPRPLAQKRQYAQEQLNLLPASYLQLERPATYPVSLSPDLSRLKQQLIEKLRGRGG